MSCNSHIVRGLTIVTLTIGALGSPSLEVGETRCRAADKNPLRVELRVAMSQSTRRGWGAVEMRLINESDRTIEVYDPLIHELLMKHAVVLAVLDRDGEYRGDLLKRTSGSVVMMTKADWVAIPPGGMLAKRREIPHGQFYDGQLEMHQLDADDWLELRLHAHALSGRPTDFIRIERERNARSYARFRERYPDRFPEPELKVADDPDEQFDRMNPLTYLEWQRTFPGEQVGVSNRLKVADLLRAGK